MRFNLQFNLSLSKLFLMIRSGSRRIILRYDLAARLSRIVRCGLLRQLLNKWKPSAAKQNIMKTNRVLLTFLLVVMALCAHAGDNNSALRKSIAMANAMCPVSLGAMGEMTSMVYEKGDLIISYALNEDVISVETLKTTRRWCARMPPPWSATLRAISRPRSTCWPARARDWS